MKKFRLSLSVVLSLALFDRSRAHVLWFNFSAHCWYLPSGKSKQKWENAKSVSRPVSLRRREDLVTVWLNGEMLLRRQDRCEATRRPLTAQQASCKNIFYTRLPTFGAWLWLVEKGAAIGDKGERSSSGSCGAHIAIFSWDLERLDFCDFIFLKNDKFTLESEHFKGRVRRRWQPMEMQEWTEVCDASVVL